MLAQLSTWILAATLGQAPPEAAWLKAVPGDVDVVIRGQGLGATRDDLGAFLKALSPALAERAVPALSGQLDQFRDKHGETAVRTPWVGLVRVVPPGAEGGMPFAILVMHDDYRDVIKWVAGGDEVRLKPQAGGFDAFDGPRGGTWYAVKGAGFVAFGPDKTLIAAVAKPGAETLDKALTPVLSRPFLAGDVGLYVNASALATRHADQIDQARQALMATLDKAGEQMGNAASMDAAKMIYGGLFDSLKDADALTLDLDFAAEGLHLAGALTVKAGTVASKAIAASQPGLADELGKLAADAAFYVSMNLEAKTFDRLQSMGMRMMSPGGKSTPDQERAMAQLRELGRIETIGSVTFDDGMRGMNVIRVSDPKAYIAAVQAMLLSLKGGEGPLNIYKDIKIDAGVETHRGFRFDHVVAKVDLDKLERLGEKNPGGAAGMKSMLGGGLSYWLGTDGTRVIQVTTPDWGDAKAQVDAFLKGDAGIGVTPAYKSLRPLLPEQASLLLLVNAQGLVRMLASQLAATLNKPDLKPPGDLPNEPAFFGASLTPRRPDGYEFHLVLPSQVGPVFEKGLMPLFQGLQQGRARP